MSIARVLRERRPRSYEVDILQWSIDQAALLRQGRFSELDLENLAEEIEDVGKSEKRELASRMAVLIAHLLKWRAQPTLRSNSWRATIFDQRRRITLALEETPSLRSLCLQSEAWTENVWLDARSQARKDMRVKKDPFVHGLPWSFDQVLDPDFSPD